MWITLPCPRKLPDMNYTVPILMPKPNLNNRVSLKKGNKVVKTLTYETVNNPQYFREILDVYR